MQKTAEDFGIDHDRGDNTGMSTGKKKKKSKKKSQIAPMEESQIQPQQMIEQLGIGIEDVDDDENKWDFPSLQI